MPSPPPPPKKGKYLLHCEQVESLKSMQSLIGFRTSICPQNKNEHCQKLIEAKR